MMRGPMDDVADPSPPAARAGPSRPPLWLGYATLALLLVAVELAVTWREGTFPSRFGLIHLLLPLYAMAVLPAVRAFDSLAASALEAARPVLTVDERGFDDLRRRSTTRPAIGVLLAGAAGVLTLLLVTLVQPADTYATLRIMVTPLATVVEWVFQLFLWSGVGIVTFDIARKLRLINEVYTRHVRIALFTPGPLYAFSRLAAGMVIFTLAVVVVASVALSNLAGTIQWAVVAGGATALAALAFVAPLWGVHRLLAAEKARQLDAVGTQIDTTIARLQAIVAGPDLADIGRHQMALDALIVAKRELSGISTWPWQRETLGGVVTALVAPLLIWAITQGLQAAVGAP